MPSASGTASAVTDSVTDLTSIAPSSTTDLTSTDSATDLISIDSATDSVSVVSVTDGVSSDAEIEAYVQKQLTIVNYI